MIKHSAIRHNGKTYAGATHADAMDAATADNPNAVDLLYGWVTGTNQGFVTDKGEFLDRRQAWGHAKECGQIADGNGAGVLHSFMLVAP